MMRIPNKKSTPSKFLDSFGIWNLFGTWDLKPGFSASKLPRRRGTGLIEVMIASAIIILVVVGVGAAYRLVIRSSREVIRGTQASLLAEEGQEAARILRDNAWKNVASSTIGTSYTLSWTGSAWSLTTTPSMIDGLFDRRVVFGSVYRNADDDIASSGTLDPQMRRVDVTVSWNNGFATTSRTVTSYLGNLFE